MNNVVGMGEGPSLLEAAWRSRLVVLGAFVVFGGFGLMLGVFRAPVFTASATVVLDAPTSMSGVETEVIPADRRVANQLEVFKSHVVAEHAAALALQSGVELTARQVLDESSFSAVAGSDVIRVRFSASDARTAEVVTSAIIEGYQEARREQRTEEVAAVVAQLDATELLLSREFRDLSALLADQQTERGLESRVAAVLDELATIQGQLSSAQTEESRSALLLQIDEIGLQLRTLELGIGIELEQPNIASLVSEREDIELRLAALQQLRIQIEAESAASGRGLAFLSAPAVDKAGGPLFTLVSTFVGLFLGATFGLAAAYALSSTRRKFEKPEEPESVLDVPYLADIPRFQDVQVKSPLPVLDAPRSPAAEAFRFVAASLGFRATRAGATIVVFVSGSVGDGKSTVAVNTALAAARSGQRVLVVDADFGNQAASRMLLGDISLAAGLSEFLTGSVDLGRAISHIEAGPGATLHLLSRGIEPIVAPDLFGQAKSKTALRRLGDHFDLVIVDPPPLLQVAYASSIVETADAAVIVVTHGTKVRKTEDLKARLTLIESEVLGYVYNRAPVRSDMVESGGSMKDVLGDAGRVETVPTRRER